MLAGTANLAHPMSWAGFVAFRVRGLLRFNGNLDIFEVPRLVLEASWRSSRRLGPLGGLLERLERILAALGGLLERLGGFLSALGTILAQNV